MKNSKIALRFHPKIVTVNVELAKIEIKDLSFNLVFASERYDDPRMEPGTGRPVAVQHAGP